jgi:hypothetical protein
MDDARVSPESGSLPVHEKVGLVPAGRVTLTGPVPTGLAGAVLVVYVKIR